ncbi:transcription factor bHLH110 isoform X1 [Amborella trichopoda]|uniref:transcription factor bHLH110 isoform X1 n=1 Tax=Amborella trichopoda TaxID=13333 RepID=UPI0009BC9E09|nr:transcription factor bHLH110 isoform X1 [Amborella trichopoda]|eukprot:XP_020524714.1 transcription factor bHLH110 isoform X1 [Amborella trichopoda]
MGSANLDHQQQDQFLSSCLQASSFHGIISSNWNQNPIMNVGNSENMMQAMKMFNLNNSALPFEPRDLKPNHEIQIPPNYSESTSMIPKLEFTYCTSSNGNYAHNSDQELPTQVKMKQEISDPMSNYGRLASEPSIFQGIQLDYCKSNNDLEEFNRNLLLKCQILGSSISARDSYQSPANLAHFPKFSRSGLFPQVLPSVEITSLYPTPSLVNPRCENLMQALNFSVTAKSGEIFHQTSACYPGSLSEARSCGLEYPQKHLQRPSSIPHKISTFMEETAGACRFGSMGSTTASEAPSKRRRFEASSSFPPFKQVRREKLGDRITALQQLVAPFGKTDTASVLMEAIGYIKFLQEQVETLSVPYMKLSGSNANAGRRRSHGDRTKNEGDKDGDGEPKRDLKSRGLCLVPLSCTTLVTSDNGAPLWPPSKFGGP